MHHEHLSTNGEEAERMLAAADKLRADADELAWELGDLVRATDLEESAARMEARALILQEAPDDIYPLF